MIERVSGWVMNEGVRGRECVRATALTMRRLPHPDTKNVTHVRAQLDLAFPCLQPHGQRLPEHGEQGEQDARHQHRRIHSVLAIRV